MLWLRSSALWCDAHNSDQAMCRVEDEIKASQKEAKKKG